MAPNDPKYDRWTPYVRAYETADPHAVQVVMGAGPINYRSNGNWKRQENFPGWTFNPQGGGSYSTDSEDLRLTAKNNVVTITDSLGTTTLTLASVDLDDDPWVAIPSNAGPTPSGSTRLTWSYLQGGVLVYLDASPQQMQLSFEITENVLSGKPVSGDAIYLRINKSGVERDWSNINAVRGTLQKDTPVLWDIQAGYIRKGVATSWLLQTYYFPIVIDPIYTLRADRWVYNSNDDNVWGNDAYTISTNYPGYYGSQYFTPGGKDPNYWAYYKTTLRFNLGSFTDGTFSSETLQWRTDFGGSSSMTTDVVQVAEPTDWTVNGSASSIEATIGNNITTTWSATNTISNATLHDRVTTKAGSTIAFRWEESTSSSDTWQVIYPPGNATYYPRLTFTFTTNAKIRFSGNVILSSSGPRRWNVMRKVMGLTDLGTITARYRAEDLLGISEGGSISSWTDASGSGNSLSNVFGSGGPIYRGTPSGFNGLPASSADDRFKGIFRPDAAMPNVIQPYTLIAFGKFNSAQNGYTAIGNASYSFGIYNNFVEAKFTSTISTGLAQDTTVRVFIIIVNGASSYIYYNATQKASGDFGPNTLSGNFCVGAEGATLSGALSQWNEIVLVPKAVSSTEINTVIMPYFRNKSGLGLL